MDRRETAATSTVRSEPVPGETRAKVLSRTLTALRDLDIEGPLDPNPSAARWLAEVTPGPGGVRQGQFVLDLGAYGQVLAPTVDLGLYVGEQMRWLTGNEWNW